VKFLARSSCSGETVTAGTFPKRVQTPGRLQKLKTPPFKLKKEKSQKTSSVAKSLDSYFQTTLVGRSMDEMDCQVLRQ
jgi:hypothetical protein